MDKLQAIHSFWTGFSWPAYNVAFVPEQAEPPYIVHESATGDFDRPVAQTATLWYRSSSMASVVAKEKEISDAITRGGKTIRYDGGALIIRKESPFGQDITDDRDDTIKGRILNYSVEYIE